MAPLKEALVFLETSADRTPAGDVLVEHSTFPNPARKPSACIKTCLKIVNYKQHAGKCLKRQ